MVVKFLGAAGEVTGSSFLVTTKSTRFLVDMGMFQGTGSAEKNMNEELLAQADFVLLTHAHLDHCGRLPLLLRQGFRGKIYANKPTVDLTYLVLKDAARVAEGNARYGGGVPLYDENEVERVMSMFEVVEYRQWKEVDGVKFRLLDAGHILGSSSIEMEIEGRKYVFSGDLGNSPSTIVKEIEEPAEAEVVVMESTYGDRLHDLRGEESKRIAELCGEIEKSKGTLLMPAFSLERTQELLLIFDHLKRSGQIGSELPVFLDSPMGLRATAIYERYPELFNEELKKQRSWDDPFDFPGLVLVEKGKQSKLIDGLNAAKVIIAGSGMMTGGRIVFHARKWLPSGKTILLFTGYQAEGTLGRHLLEGSKSVVIDGLEVKVGARIEEITSMSAHADEDQLMEWLKEIKKVKKVILVHGEDSARKVFKDRLEKELGLEVLLPYLKEELDV